MTREELQRLYDDCHRIARVVEDGAEQLAARAEAAEQAAQRVRGLAGELRAKHYLAPTATADAILRALDGGEQHG